MPLRSSLRWPRPRSSRCGVGPRPLSPALTLAIVVSIGVLLAEQAGAVDEAKDCSIPGSCEEKASPSRKNRYAKPAVDEDEDEDDYDEDEDATKASDKASGTAPREKAPKESANEADEDSYDEYYEDGVGSDAAAAAGGGKSKGADQDASYDDYYEDGEQEDGEEGDGEDYYNGAGGEGDEGLDGSDYYDEGRYGDEEGEEGEEGEEREESEESAQAEVCRKLPMALRKDAAFTPDEIYAAVAGCPPRLRLLQTASMKLAFEFNESFWGISAMLQRGVSQLEEQRAACTSFKCTAALTYVLNQTNDNYIGLAVHIASAHVDKHKSLEQVLEAHNITRYALELYPMSTTLRSGVRICEHAANEFPVVGSGELSDAGIFSTDPADRPAGASVLAPEINLAVIDDFLSADEVAALVEHIDPPALDKEPPMWCFGSHEFLQSGVGRLLEKYGISRTRFYTPKELSNVKRGEIRVSSDSVTGPVRQCLRMNRSAVLGELVAEKGGIVTATTFGNANPALQLLTQRVEQVSSSRSSRLHARECLWPLCSPP
jgi:hypothetical protein